MEGRDFSIEYPGDEVAREDTVGAFLVNEETVKVMGLDNKSAIGARFDFMGIKGKIIGVMKDFHYYSVKSEIEPLAMALAPGYVEIVTVRLAPENIAKSLHDLKNSWFSVAGGYPFEYRFLDEDFRGWYRSEERMLTLLEIFALTAIIIACLGLFGLASFTSEQRTKEIGIRKVLGATEINLTYLMSKEFLLLVIISNLIAFPVAYFVSNWWLQSFAYRININIWTFLLAGSLSIIIAILTVSYQSIKAASANPVKSLRYE